MVVRAKVRARTVRASANDVLVRPQIVVVVRPQVVVVVRPQVVVVVRTVRCEAAAMVPVTSVRVWVALPLPD